MTDTKDIVPKKSVDDLTWGQIVDELVLELNGTDLPESVIEVTEYLLSGYSIYEAAQKVSLPASTIRGWISRYPVMAGILAKNRESLIRWRMSKLEGQFLQAVNKSQELLDVGLAPNAGVSPKMYGAVAQHVRYILGLFAGQKIDIQVTHNLGNVTLNAKQDALDYIVDQLERQRENADNEPIETTYRVIDSKYDQGPLLDNQGKSHHGEIGVLDTNTDGSLCHICGKRYKGLDQHVERQHNMQIDEYETFFMLDHGSLKNARKKPK